MNRTKSFLVAAGILLAMAFVFSCSSDNKDDDKDDNKNDNNNKSGYCLDSYWFGGGNYCIKTIDGCNGVYAVGLSMHAFSEICPSGYDRSPKACFSNGGCVIITPEPVLGSNKILESDCIDRGFTVVDYNTTCVK